MISARKLRQSAFDRRYGQQRQRISEFEKSETSEISYTMSENEIKINQNYFLKKLQKEKTKFQNSKFGKTIKTLILTKINIKNNIDSPNLFLEPIDLTNFTTKNFKKLKNEESKILPQKRNRNISQFENKKPENSLFRISKNNPISTKISDNLRVSRIVNSSGPILFETNIKDDFYSILQRSTEGVLQSLPSSQSKMNSKTIFIKNNINQKSTDPIFRKFCLKSHNAHSKLSTGPTIGKIAQYIRQFNPMNVHREGELINTNNSSNDFQKILSVHKLDFFRIKRLFEQIKNNSNKKELNFETKEIFYHLSEKSGISLEGRSYLGYQLISGLEVFIKKKKTTNKSQIKLNQLKEDYKIMKVCDKSRFVLRIYECFEDQNWLFIVSEFHKYQTLESFLQKQPNAFSGSKSNLFFYKLLIAIKHLNDNNCIHGRLNIRNILVSDNYEPIIFKMSAEINATWLKNDSSEESENNHKQMNLPKYTSEENGGNSKDELKKVINKLDDKYSQFIAPELMSNKSAVHTKSDVWSLGVIFYYLKFLEFPFSDKNDLLAQMTNEDFEVLGKKRPMSAPEGRLLTSMLKNDLKKRITVEKLIEADLFDQFRERQTNFERKQNDLICLDRKKADLFLRFVDFGISEDFIANSLISEVDNHIVSCFLRTNDLNSDKNDINFD